MIKQLQQHSTVMGLVGFRKSYSNANWRRFFKASGKCGKE